jgi:hypothetical protein
MSKLGKRMIAGLKEARAIARGEKKAPRISVFITLQLTLRDDGQFSISSPDLPQLRLGGPNPSVVCKALGVGLAEWLKGELWVTGEAPRERFDELREMLDASIAQGGDHSADDVRRFLADRRRKPAKRKRAKKAKE